MAKRILMLIAIAALIGFGACAAPPVPAQTLEVVEEKAPEPMRVIPRAVVSRDAETGTLTVRVFPMRCVSISHRPVGDTLSVSVDQNLRVITVEGNFLFDRAIGGVKKLCQRLEKQFDFENTAPLRYDIVLPYAKSPFMRGKTVADFRYQEPPNSNLSCEVSDPNEPFVIDGIWRQEGSAKPGYELGSLDGTSLIIRSEKRFGGEVPQFEEAKAPYTFDLLSLGTVEFKSATCGLITLYRAAGPTRRLVKVRSR
ncbi:MAG: hypothetical protein AAFX02_04520 [Pseudomonadota bacterium]